MFSFLLFHIYNIILSKVYLIGLAFIIYETRPYIIEVKKKKEKNNFFYVVSAFSLCYLLVDLIYPGFYPRLSFVNHYGKHSHYRKREYHNKFSTYGGCRFSLSCSAIGSRSCQSRGHACKRFLIGHSGPMRLKEGVLKGAGAFLQQEISLAAKFTSFILIGSRRLSIR